MDYEGTKIRLKFNKNILKQDKSTYNHGKIINIYIDYEIRKNYNGRNHPTLEKSLFGAVKSTKSTGVNNYNYSGYVIGFDGHGNLLHPDI